MIQYFGNDVRRINHALKVYGFAKTLGELETIGGEELQVLEVAAVLHDIGIKESERKHNSSSGTYQEIEGPPIARKLLSDFQLEREFIDRVCYLIGNHHTYSKIDNRDFQILVEADLLVNIFEDNLSAQAIKLLKEKYFKTKSGISLLECMFQS
ncbi:HD domain-containing protein [Desulfosporosinus sp. PR]|uniref:HD domain-containing protein n=1 Tax=Candidatus Desulfosporosinus nitrosoreducens TaxID=3401928 RepID=UPI0027F8B1E8|nr:HD domain-containing protein [Desulfosporosinus sp. PR]MDQ7092625.1 HD domain-containing protein [Desulfosporosinus sp. PR]